MSANPPYHIVTRYRATPDSVADQSASRVAVNGHGALALCFHEHLHRMTDSGQGGSALKTGMIRQ
jgi:hypothetical protein